MPLWWGSVSTDGVFYGHSARCYLFENTVYINRAKAISLKSNGFTQTDYPTAFAIRKVVGYK